MRAAIRTPDASGRRSETLHLLGYASVCGTALAPHWRAGFG